MLIDRGHHVKALVQKEVNGLAGLQMEFVKGDVTSESDLVNLCSDCELVFHLAAYISIRKTDPICRMVNVDGCMNLVRAARSTGIKKIIHFSSIHAFYEEPLAVELNETRALSTDSTISYNRSKALGQKMMLDASSKDLEIIVLCPTSIIGPNDFKPSLMGNALIRFYNGQNPFLVPGGFNWVDVRDVCTAAINAIESGMAGACYLLGGSWQSLGTLAQEIEKQGGHKRPRLELPMWLAQAGAPLLNLQSLLSKKAPLYTAVSLQTINSSHRNISSERAKKALGYNPRPFRETLSDTLAWFRENNYI